MCLSNKKRYLIDKIRTFYEESFLEFKPLIETLKEIVVRFHIKADSAIKIILELFANTERLNRMKEANKKLAKPSAVDNIVKLIKINT